MLFCNKCNVSIRTNHSHCPLCQGELTGTSDEKDPIFPEIPETSYPGMPFFRWFSFACVVVAIAAVSLNFMISTAYWWSLFVVGGMLCMWVALAVGIVKRHNLLKNAIWQLIVISAAVLLWDVWTGWAGWSMEYVIPAVCILTIASMLTISTVQHLPVQEYMSYWLMAGVFGLLPLIPLLLQKLTVRYPSVICIGTSLVFLAYVAIFRHKEMAAELRKKFHL